MTPRRRVLHLLPDLQRGGGQVVVLEFVTHCDHRRYQPFVARLRSPDDYSTSFERAGVTPIRLRRGHRSALWAAFEVARALRAREIDLLHVHSDLDRKVGQLAAILTGTPVVGHLHSPWAHLAPMHAPGAGALARSAGHAKAELRRWLERRTVRHYVAAGDAVADFHRSRVSAPITIAANGVDTARFAPPTPAARAEARARWGFAGTTPTLLCVGRLAAGKGQDELIAALSSLPGATLVLAGSGEQLGSLQDLADQHGVLDRVRFLGDTDDVLGLLWASDLFVMASVSEGLPLSVLEALATGLPVVAYALPGLRGVVTDGIEGRLVTPGDRVALAAAIAATVGDEPVRAAMGAAARRTVEASFDARLMARAIEAVYERTLAGDRADRGSIDAVDIVPA